MTTIEKLIRIPAFKSEEQKLIVSLYYVNGLIVNHFERILTPYQISFQQFNVLRILRGQHPNPASVVLIRERMLDRNSDASRVVGRLVKADLAKSSINRVDKRKADVYITSKGLEVLRQLDDKENQLIEAVKGLNSEECLLANQMLQKLLDQLTK